MAMQPQNSASMEASRRRASRLQAALGACGLTEQAFADNVPGRPGTAWSRNHRQGRHYDDENRMIKASLRYRFAVVPELVCALLLAVAPAKAADKTDPETDRKAFQAFFFARFPNVAKDDFGNGPYAVNEEMRKQWKEIMEFPPYELALDEGRAEWDKPFANGKHYADCFDNKGEGIRQTYPRFITETGQVETLEGAINRCRIENGEKPLDPMTGMMASLTAVMAESSRGKPFAISIPDDPRALVAYERGKEFFYSRKGQLGISCASCHISPAGERMRGDILAPALGILAAMPIYRSDWGSMGTTIRRISTCSSQTRAVPLNADDEDYRDLEYFLSYMSNGIAIVGPGTRP
jgi:L-cysteine S-thiosulfotransferase